MNMSKTKYIGKQRVIRFKSIFFFPLGKQSTEQWSFNDPSLTFRQEIILSSFFLNLVILKGGQVTTVSHPSPIILNWMTQKKCYSKFHMLLSLQVKKWPWINKKELLKESIILKHGSPFPLFPPTERSRNQEAKTELRMLSQVPSFSQSAHTLNRHETLQLVVVRYYRKPTE